MGDARQDLSQETRKQLDDLARSMVRDSILEKAATRFIAQISAEYGQIISELKSEIARLEHVKATIRVNAVKGMGCSETEADAYANGTAEKTFIEAMSEHVAKQST